MAHEGGDLKATHEEMKAARLPIDARSACAHMLIPLNKCRQETSWLPFKCGHERHEYERCEYVEWLKNVKARLDSQ